MSEGLNVSLPNAYTITIEDDPTIAKIIEVTLGIPNINYPSFDEFMRVEKDQPPCAVFVDVHLGPNKNGIDSVPEVLKKWPGTPVIVITADKAEDVVEQALAAGAADFIYKPINPRELTARLKVRIDDYAKRMEDVINFGDCQLDLRYCMLKGPKGTQYISNREKEMLAELIRARGMVLPKSMLKRKLWGNLKVSDNAFDRKVFEVRKALRSVSEDTQLFTKYGAGMYLRYVRDDEIN